MIIDGELLDHNKYINLTRSNKYLGAKAKKEATETVAYYTVSNALKKIDKKVDVKVTHYCKNRRKDKDNIAFTIKFILDGLILGGIIDNDGWNEIGKLEFDFKVDKENPRIKVELTETEG